MGFKYAVTSKEKYFVTLTVVDWVDVFKRKELSTVIIDSLRHCQQHKQLKIFAWCLMPSHLHLVVAVYSELLTLSDVMRDFKKYTSKSVVKTISEIAESRKEWLLDRFMFAGKYDPKIKDYKFWQDGFHPIELTTVPFIEQKINYIHQNPVEACIVYRAEDYVFSSASQYAGEFNGWLQVVVIEDINLGIVNPLKLKSKL